jgi:hypothetical protein
VCGGGAGLARGKDKELNRSEVCIKLDRDDGKGPSEWLLPTDTIYPSY